MFRSIVVPVDFTVKNRAALRVARDLAREFGARVTLLHVIEPIEHLSRASLRGFYKSLETTAVRKMAVLARALPGTAAPVRSIVVYGKRAEGIVDYAVAKKVDLIVLASHRARTGGRERPAWPTISHRVAVLAPCAVLLVR